MEFYAHNMDKVNVDAHTSRTDIKSTQHKNSVIFIQTKADAILHSLSCKQGH